MKTRTRIPRDVQRAYTEAGIYLYRAKGPEDQSNIGIHLASPTPGALWDALEAAERDGFPAVYIHEDLGFSYSEFTPEMRRARFVVLQGGAA